MTASIPVGLRHLLQLKPSSISSNQPEKKIKICAHQYPPWRPANVLASCQLAELDKKTWSCWVSPSKHTWGCSHPFGAEPRCFPTSVSAPRWVGLIQPKLLGFLLLLHSVPQDDSAVFWDLCFDHFSGGTWRDRRDRRDLNFPPCLGKMHQGRVRMKTKPMNLFFTHTVFTHLCSWGFNSLRTPLSYQHLHFIHFSRSLKSHLLHEDFSVYEFIPSPGLPLYLRSISEFNVNIDHALCFFFPPCFFPVPHTMLVQNKFQERFVDWHIEEMSWTSFSFLQEGTGAKKVTVCGLTYKTIPMDFWVWTLPVGLF